MVQGIENLTHIMGHIVARERHPTLADFDLVRLHVTAAEPVSGKANLLAESPGQEIGLVVRRDLLGEARIGDILKCRAKRTPDGAMAEPHPDPGDFTVMPKPRET
jgi:hypothetical protein